MIEAFDILILPLAQVQDGGALQFSGGVGNIIAAALETKGLIDQASILVNFRETIEIIAALAWLFSICMALGAVAVFGNYRQGLYFLLGPPLFYYMITTTIPTDGAKAIFGNREIANSEQQQKNILSWIRAIENDEGSVDVSFFFGMFDSVITEVVQSVVALLLDEDNNADLRFVAREHVLSRVLKANSGNAELNNLVLGYHMGSCGDTMSSILAQASVNDNARIRVKNTAGSNAIADKALEHEWNVKSVVLPPTVINYLIGLKSQEDGNLIPYENENHVIAVSCADIWNFTRVGLLSRAKEVFDPVSLQLLDGAESSIPIEEVLDDVGEFLVRGVSGEDGAQTQAERDQVYRIVAAYIYKNMLVNNTHSALQGQIFNRAPVNNIQYEAVFGHNAAGEARSGFQKVKFFSSLIPYIQGIMLYLLCIAFPFFAVFLVMPGRATSFLVWCSLWAWIKSWDIGFAIVHVIRDVYWSFMRDKVNHNNTTFEWSEDPTSVYKVIFSNDPLFNQDTYWIIASVLTLSVPFITAHLAMGANTYLGMFSNSLDKTVNRFGNLQRNQGKRRQANITERMQFEGIARHKRAGAEAGSKDKMMANMYGQRMPLMDKRKGVFYGFSGKDGSTRTGGDSRFAGVRDRGLQLQAFIQNASNDKIDGGMQSSIQRAKDLETKHQAVNAIAKTLEGKGDHQEALKKASKLTGKEIKSLDDLKAAFGYRTSKQSSKLNDLHRQAAKANPNEKKSIKSQISKIQKSTKSGPINLAEQIPHIDRGGMQLTGEFGKLSQESMKRYVSDNKEMASLFSQYGRANDAKRARGRAREMQKLVNNKESITWGQYIKYERNQSNNMQDSLAIVTGRKAFALKKSAGRNIMHSRLIERQNVALNAQHFFDEVNKPRNIPFVNEGYYQFNREGKGLNFNGSIYGGDGSSLAPLITSGLD